MPLNNETPSTHARQEFCVALRAARVRKGITLDEIAATTKIPAGRLDALERNDLKYWPKGLFRRSFFRDYAKAVGLPVEEMCAEFVRLFPDDTATAVIAPAATAPPAAAISQEEDARLTLDATWHGPHEAIIPRLITAALDAATVILISGAIALLSDFSAYAAAGVVALSYFSLSTLLFGESAAKRAISAYRSTPDVTEPVADPESSEWITDAYRVAPAPRLRVRFKVSQ